MRRTTVYRGPSRLDGKRIRAWIVPHGNAKVGRMMQLFISPDRSGWYGNHASVCGECPLKPKAQGGSGGCYVDARGVIGAFGASSPTVESVPPTLPAPLRLGAWGDPAALPLALLRRLVRAAPGHTGYTHQWRRFPALRSLVMASVESRADAEDARARGWRTFRVSLPGAPVPRGEILCPAYSHGTSCADCRLCDGSKATDTRASIAIPAHGPSGKLDAALSVVRGAGG